MEEILKRLSSYNIFNYLLPGTLFAFVGDQIISFKLIQDDILIALFLYYFFGLVISRIGSFVIGPVLRRTRFVNFAKYEDYIDAANKDKTIEVLSEMNNMYRTLCALVLCLIIVYLYDGASEAVPELVSFSPHIILVSLFLLFLFSYRKQTGFVVKRVNHAKD